MNDFPEGRANFAVDETTLMHHAVRPEYMSEKVRSFMKVSKKEAREKYLKELIEISRVLDNPEKDVSHLGREKNSNEKSFEELSIPDRWSFPIKKSFRMFISSLPLDTFPPNFARKCTKMCLQLPMELKRNAEKNFYHIKKEHF